MDGIFGFDMGGKELAFVLVISFQIEYLIILLFAVM